MAKQIRFFYNKIFVTLFSILIVPLLRLLGIGGEAFATDTACYAGQCTLNNTRYIACATGLQKQVCNSCTYEQWVFFQWPDSNWVLTIVDGTYWKDSGSCTTYANECSYVGQTSSTSCTNEVGSGTQTRTCAAIVVGGTTYLMWGEYGTCVYTSCAESTDVLDSGKCYCTSSCSMTNGYGTMIAQLRVSSLCPIASSSSSSVVP
ncbi:MAG: hypothetical protein JW974_02255 [Alphaproteobacteria bacterium]|nr:hypothetical protein [Alphaproteobacteria bacterium]